MATPTSISLARSPAQSTQSPDEAFRISFARSLTHAINTSQIIPETEVGKLERFAAMLNTDTSIVAGWLTGRSLPDAYDLHKISKLLNIPVDEIFSPGQILQNTNHLIDENYHCINVHDSLTSDGFNVYTLPETLRFLKFPRRTAMLSVPDESMAPILKTGDIAIYDTRVNSLASNGLYVLKNQDGFFVRRVQHVSSVQIDLIPENKAFEHTEHVVTAFSGNPEADDKIVIIGRVVGRMCVGNL